MTFFPMATVVLDLFNVFGPSDGEKTRNAIKDLKQSMHSQFSQIPEKIKNLGNYLSLTNPINAEYLKEKTRLERLDKSNEEGHLKECNSNGWQFL
jgi:hypothetical protein